MFFCLGNICRSPIAEGLFRAKVEARGLGDHFHIESSGTSSYHAGDKPDPGSLKVMQDRIGVDISYQRSQQLRSNHLIEFEYIVGMDAQNILNAQKLGSGHLFRLRDFDPEGPGDVPDPWGDGGAMFEVVFDMVDRSTEALLEHLIEHHNLTGG